MFNSMHHLLNTNLQGDFKKYFLNIGLVDRILYTFPQEETTKK